MKQSLAIVFFLFYLLLGTPLAGISQEAQAIMDIKVNVIRGATGLQQKIIFDAEDFSFENRRVIDSSLSEKSITSISADSILFFKYNTYPNHNVIVSVEPVHQLINQNGEEITFVIDAMGFSHKPDTSSITYFNTFNCNSFQTNTKGKAYLWVDGRILLPANTKLNGTFKGIEVGNIQCAL